ncbi:MAG: CRISPR-associated endonuclease Cas1 [Planctomycetota bacterium]|nr:MAG: CRISPR-associated endonuclease Cas1 [Planctomycetota bacterium]
MLNEFCYCPRLAYLEWVQGEFTDNLDTREGRFVHRRVDSRDDRPVPDAEEAASCEKLHARSLLLSAPSERLIAKIDLVDFQPGSAVPIDYKRGKVPDIPERAWEPDRVQLCAQGLILRANGYECNHGILYYVGSRRRVTVSFDSALVARTRELLAELIDTAAAGKIPPPLKDSPKCPRCSLVGICLPDETCLAAETRESPAQASPRRLIPSSHPAFPLYVNEQGVTLGKDGNVLTVKRRKEIIQKVRLLDVSQVCLFGNVQLTAQALREITAAGIPIAHFSYGGWFYALTSGLIHKNVELRAAQFAAAADPNRSLRLARRFIVGKIKNARTLLRRHLKPVDSRLLRRLKEAAIRAETAPDLAHLLGIEGAAAKEYFAGFARVLGDRYDFNITHRNRRPPRDPVNALLSFVYAMLVKEWTIVLHSVGFDPMQGFLHRPRYGRPSLALDMAEEFRVLVGDSVVLTVINNREVDSDSFVARAGSVALTDAGRRAVLAAFERRMNTEIIHPIFNYRLSYRRIFEVQARLLARTLTGEIPHYPPFVTR